MTRYTYCRNDSGEVVGACDGDAATAEINTPVGCVRVEGDYPRSAWYWCDGAMVPYTPQQAAAKAVRPGPWARWSNSAMAWVDSRAPQQALEDQWARVRAERDRVFGETVDRLNPLRWSEMSAEQQAAWAVYRQQLRDITLQPDPFAIAWPTPPAE